MGGMKWLVVAAGIAVLTAASAALSAEVRADWWAISHAVAHVTSTSDLSILSDTNALKGLGFFLVAAVGFVVLTAVGVRRMMDRPKTRRGFDLEQQ